MFSSLDAKRKKQSRVEGRDRMIVLSLFSSAVLSWCDLKKSLFDWCWQDDQTPLHISSRLGKQDIVQQLLANGACPDATTSSGYTPLHLAAREGHRDVAATLLDNGANLSIITKVTERGIHL